MSGRVFILGGTRSGKSRYAVRRAGELGGDAVTFIATARAGDEELEARIVLHRASRPSAWPTIEADADLAGAVRGVPGDRVLLVDSLTLWVSTVTERAGALAARWSDLDAALEARTAATVLVSDEIGLGMVPLSAAARRYRDELGWLHQRVAETAGEVWLMVAGVPLRVKGAP